MIPFRNRLAYRQATLVVAIAVVLGLLSGLFQVFLDYEDQKRRLERGLENHVGAVSQPASNALWELNEDLATAIIEGLFGYDTILEVRLLTTSNFVLAERRRALSDDRYMPISDWLFGKGMRKEIDLIHDDGGNAVPVGTLEVFCHPYPVAVQFLNRALVVFLSGVAKSIVLAGVLLFFFYLTLTKPLASLVRQLDGIDPTAPESVRVTVAPRNRDDELGRIADAANEHMQLIGAHISELKAADAALREANAELESKVQVRTGDLRAEIEARTHIENRLRHALEDARQSALARTQFLANMSHELRTPLNAIIGYSEYGKLHPENIAGKKLEEVFGHIHFAGSHLLTLVNSILDLTRMEAGQMPVEAETFDLGPLIDEVTGHLQPVIAGNDNTLRTVIDPDLPQIHSDKLKARQVLFNLIGNAAKFTEKGDITVEAVHDAGTETISVSVLDTGIGIDASDIDAIFENFTQADANLNRRYDGSGLGLAIVRNICDLLGWKIVVASRLGEGSRFTLVISVDPAESVKDASAHRLAADD